MCHTARSDDNVPHIFEKQVTKRRMRTVPSDNQIESNWIGLVNTLDPLLYLGLYWFRRALAFFDVVGVTVLRLTWVLWG